MTLITDFAALQAQMAAAQAILDAALPAMANVASEIAQLAVGNIPVVAPIPLPTITGTTYYVSAVGDDNAAGTQAAPWKSIGKVNSTTFKTGDAILFRGGDLFAGSIYGIASNFPGSNVIASYGTGNAIIYSGSSNGITTTNVPGLWIGNITVLGVGGSVNKGIYIQNDGTVGMLAGPQVRGVTVTGYGSDGILIFGHPGAGFSNLVVDSSISYANTYGDTGTLTSGIGIWAGGATTSNPTFLNPTVTNNKAYQNSGCAGPNWSGSGIFIQGSKGGVNAFNETYQNGAASNASNGSGPVGNWTADSDGLLIQFNESYSNSSMRADGGGFDLDGGVINCIFQFNYAHDNRNYGLTCYIFEGDWGNNIVRFNILANNIGSQFTYGATGGANTLGALYVHNNIMIGDARYTDQSWHAVIACPDWLPQVFTKVLIVNNLIDSSAGGWAAIIDSSMGTTTFQKNCYAAPTSYVKWGGVGYTGISAWQAATSQDSGAIVVADPLLASRYADVTTHGYAPSLLGCYKCQTGSPLLGAGLDVTTLGLQQAPTDYFGAAIPAGVFNVGAGD